jgi:NAD(P)-dependent dehydrogenase (short-subunit alcohol dehydrogenase family)
MKERTQMSDGILAGTTARVYDQQALAGSRVVVVGGTSGMGLGAVRTAQAAGAEVVVAGRRPAVERTPVGGDEERITHLVVDVTDEASVKALFEQVGAFDHLLVTAAPAPGSWGPMLEQDLAAAQEFLSAKFWGSWLCARYGAPQIGERGSITFLTGCNVRRPMAGASIVAASFAALEKLAEPLTLELAPIRVNTIRPGLVNSEMWDFMEPAQRETFHDAAAGQLPVGRSGRISDIGEAAVFLMTNGYATGTVIEVSGGEPLVNLDL